ncbi:hypothetical protein JKG68_25475 [Microvirga aerilata]|uniref:Uncharacterized protein n=1 Tax=Microvirga aerilata TaxID=670292 RepID=A0A937D495_9HYPH|nr:hypothetical protein [Microvirga aerilata]MBL0407280.1 hypothetical protein [Microvirga aerilata]
MNNLHKLRSRGNENLCLLPLFAWAASQPTHPHPLVARKLSSRFGLSPALALTIAELAGLSMEVSNG